MNQLPIHHARQTYFLDVIRGERRGFDAAALRTLASCIEPINAAIVSGRNWGFDHGWIPRTTLPLPVISIGNITAGGTGKTPVVQWLARKLASSNHRPAILLRGYKSTADGISDEATLLQKNLHDLPSHQIVANPSRVLGAQQALRNDPSITTFILDDAMQHRQVRRDFELVLLHANHAIEHDHLLPRGLMREPIIGLHRAQALLITHASEIDPATLEKKTAFLRRFAPSAPIFHADHRITALVRGNEEISTDALRSKKYLAFCGIGSPESFFAGLRTISPPVATQAFPDHHEYSRQDVLQLQELSRQCGAEILVTTQKDWTRFSPVLASMGHGDFPPVYVASLSIAFWNDDADRLFSMIQRALSRGTNKLS